MYGEYRERLSVDYFRYKKEEVAGIAPNYGANYENKPLWAQIIQYSKVARYIYRSKSFSILFGWRGLTAIIRISQKQTAKYNICCINLHAMSQPSL